MRKELQFIIFLFVTFCHTALFAQNKAVTGKVTGPDKKAISGASVVVNRTTIGTTTDDDGNFRLEVPPNATLLITYIGFADQLVKVGTGNVVNVEMASATGGLEEVVVTGYTSQRKKDIVGAVAVVDVKALKQAPSTSAAQALQGQASGVNVTNNGSPGASSQIFIRGITGFANDPLVLIDGIQGNINDVPTSDIESIQVLKDAGAASIYGARGSNGVIVITTKKGKSGTPSVSYDSYYNFQIPRSGSSLNTLNAQEWSGIMSQINPSNGMFINGQLADFFYRGPGVSGAATAGSAAVDPDLYRYRPNQSAQNYIISAVDKNRQGGQAYDEIFHTALMMNQNVSVSGGSDKSSYLISLGYLDQQGTILNTYLKRYNARINSTYKITKNIRIGENINLYYKDNPQTFVNGSFGPVQQAMSQVPVISTYDIDGQFAGAFSGPQNAALGDWSNALADVTHTDNNRSRQYGMIGNVFVEIDFLKHFTAKTSVGGALTNYYNQTYSYTQYWKANGGASQRLEERSGFASMLQWTNTLSYRNQIGKHNIAVLAGTESVENKARQLYGYGDKFLSDDYNYLILDNAQIRYNPTSSASEDALFSLIGRVDYNYDEKYLMGFTIRRDGFSAFGSNNKYGVFPSIAVGWRLSRENFMTGVTFVNDLKIRGSYGIMGNKEGISPFNSYTTYAQGPRYSYYDITGSGNSIAQGFYPAQNGNPNTSWEKNKLFNVGFDATVLNNSLDVSVDYYQKKTEGLLRRIQAAATGGEAVSPFVNIGNIENKGLDLSVTYRGKISKNVLFNVGVNFTTYKNKVVKLEDPGYYEEGVVRVEEGYPLTSFYGYKIIGVFRDSNEVKSAATQDAAAPGRYRYYDRDTSGVIDNNDRVHFGNADPDFTMGINLGLVVKNFDFSAIIYTSQGNDIYNNSLEWLGSFERGVSNKTTRVLDAWSPSNPNSNIKMNETGRNFSNSAVVNNDFLEDGSFWRLRSLQAGYTLPASVLKSLHLTKLRVSVTAVNLLTLTKYSGLDPEVASTGAVFRGQDAGAYVQERGVSFGLSVGF